ncbi:MAG TPA: FHA domain-containing protein, partial [Verrucomicrobiae bacterium]|nr:FHA domain-containing protein [Verrucomicrobiae bacterium]
MSRLLANLGTPDQWEIPLVPGVYLLGRGTESHFSIDHPSISHAHCEVLVTEDGLVTVKDLGSANGTFIDRAAIQECQLSSGQTLRLGEVELLYDADTPDDLTVVTPPPSPSPGDSAVADPPLPPPVSTALAMCRNHPRAIARLQCVQCRSHYCDICVSVRSGGSFCRRCGGECVALNPDVRLQVEDVPEFFSAMRSAFAYPLQGDGWILIIAGGLFFTVLGLARYVMGFGFLVMAASLVVSVFAAGYLFSYLQRIITTSAGGEKQLPDWPDFSGFDDVIGPCFQFGAAIFGCFLPAIAVLVLAGTDSEWAGQLIWPALLFGCFYLPMAFLAVAMFDTVSA